MRLWPGKKKVPAVAAEPHAVVAEVAGKAPKTAKSKSKKTGKLKVSVHVRKRFEDYLDKRNRKCWGWKGSRTSDGYGQFWLNDHKVVKAHRFAYEVFVRQLSAKDRLKNICKGKSCINPACWQVQTVKRRRP